MNVSPNGFLGGTGILPGLVRWAIQRGRAATGDPDPAFAQMEHESEILIAALRVAVFVVVAGVFWWTGAIDRDHSVLFSLGGFGIVTVASASLVLAGYHRAWLPWLYATLDISLLVHCLAVYAVAMKLPAEAMLGLPGTWMLFLYLAMSVIRYRPLLVLYSGALFVAGWALVWFLAQMAAPSTAGEAVQVPLSPDMAFAGQSVRLAVIVVTVVLLVLTGARMRHSLEAALVDARLRATLARHFAHSVVGELARTVDSQAPLREQSAAVLFVDIRGFTSLAEHLPAVEVAQLLSEYRDRIARPVAQFGGSIDKFIGDGVMIVFGIPKPASNDARNALNCAVAITRTIEAWSRDRARMGRAPIHAGVGVHFGPVVAGVLGNRDRLEFTVIGDTVNVANRIEEHSATCGLSIVVSEDVLTAADELPSDVWRILGDLPVRGRRRSVRVYGLARELDAADKRSR